MNVKGGLFREGTGQGWPAQSQCLPRSRAVFQLTMHVERVQGEHAGVSGWQQGLAVVPALAQEPQVASVGPAAHGVVEGHRLFKTGAGGSEPGPWLRMSTETCSDTGEAGPPQADRASPGRADRTSRSFQYLLAGWEEVRPLREEI
jgi:hypothetical protein